MISKFLKQPFPTGDHSWRVTLSVALFVASFMLIFQPFGFSLYQGEYKLFILAGYGAVTFFCLFVILILLPSLFKRVFVESNWVVWKEMLKLWFIVFCIGIGNYCYSYLLHIAPQSFKVALLFQLFTLTIAIIPIVTLTFVAQNQLLSKNLKQATLLNEQIITLKKPSQETYDGIIRFVSANDKGFLTFAVSDLLYIESKSNYIEVSFLKGGMVTTVLRRCSLKEAELQFVAFPEIIKCHRGFIVNSMNIAHVKGNSQGYRLLFNKSDVEVPVARSYAKTFQDFMKSNC